MSGQIVGLAPATRVASRKLGPVAGTRSSPRAWAACATSTFAKTCGRCETVAITGRGRRRRSPSVLRRSRQRPVQTLVELPRGRRARREIPGRAVEEVGASVLDARGFGARERVAADEARIVGGGDDARLVEPTSVTTQSVGAAARTSSIAAGSALIGAATKTICASWAASPGLAAVAAIAPRRCAAASVCTCGSKPVSSASRRCAKREADRAADQPDADDADPHARANALPASAAACSTRLA